jgi:hypothetical protein
MLAVGVQLPAGVLTDDPCGVAGRAPSRSELEPEPEASAGAANTSTAQVAVPTDLMLTTKPPLAWTNEARIGRKTLRLSYKSLKPSETLGPGRPVRPHRAPGLPAGKTLTHKAVETHVANEERLLDASEPDDQRAPDHDLEHLPGCLLEASVQRRCASRAPPAHGRRGIKGLLRSAKQMRMQRRLVWFGTDEGG